MKIKYLGTAAAEGWPGLFCNCEYCDKARELGSKNIRTRSQSLVDDCLLIDFPSDTYMHALVNGLPLHHIQNLIVTHSHADHFFMGDFFTRFDVFAHKPDGELKIFGNDAVCKEFNEKLGKHLKKDNGIMSCHEIFEFAPMQIGQHTVTPLLANHTGSEKCYIYMIEKDGKRLLYGNDTGDFPQQTWDYIKGKQFDLVSLDCTTGWEKDGDYHMGIPDMPEMKQKLQDLGCTKDSTVFVATHFSHNGRYLHHELEAELAQYGFIVAYDGREVEF